MEKHRCEFQVKIGGYSGATRQCRKDGVVVLNDKWYCRLHADKVLNTPGSPENLALIAHLTNTKTPSNCELEACKYNQIQPSDNSQECIGCSYNKNPDWKPSK